MEKSMNKGWQIATWILIAAFVLGFVAASNIINGAYDEGVNSVEIPEAIVCPDVIVCDEVICDECTEIPLTYFELAQAEAFKEILDDWTNGYEDDEIKWYGTQDEYTFTALGDGNWELEFERDVKYNDDHDKEVIEYQFLIEYDEEDNDYDVEIIEL